MECGLSSLVYSYKIVYRDNMYIIAKKKANSIQKTSSFFCILRYWRCGGRWGCATFGAFIHFKSEKLL